MKSYKYALNRTLKRQEEIIIKFQYRPNIKMSGLEQTAVQFIEMSDRDFTLLRAINS